MPEPFDIALQGEYHLSGILPELNGSILSISVQPSSMGSVAYVELALYALPEEKAVSIKDDWKVTLARLFPTPEAPVLTGGLIGSDKTRHLGWNKKRRVCLSQQRPQTM